MDSEDEDIPDLVAAGDGEIGVDTITAEVDDLQVAKVPISIITGKCT